MKGHERACEYLAAACLERYGIMLAIRSNSFIRQYRHRRRSRDNVIRWISYLSIGICWL